MGTLKSIFTILLLSTHSVCIAQYWSQMSMVALDPYREISAYGGLDRATTLTGRLRTQWDGLEGRPNTQYLSVHSPVYLWRGAVGLDITTQNQGSLNLNRIRASYNYVMGFGGGLLSIGGRLSMMQSKLNQSTIITPNGNYQDGSILHNDPLLGSGIRSSPHLQYEVSAVYAQPAWLVGLGISDLSPIRIDSESPIRTTRVSQLFFRNFFSISQHIDIQTSIALKSDFIVLQSELSAIAKINGNVFGGLTLRGFNATSADALGFLIGYNINKSLSLFYNYDSGISGLRQAHIGSHELLVKYRLDKVWGSGLPPKIIYNPRHL